MHIKHYQIRIYNQKKNFKQKIKQRLYINTKINTKPERENKHNKLANMSICLYNYTQ